MRMAIGVLAMALAGGGMAAGEEYHVAADGSGRFKTVQEAADAVKPGDTVVIHAGTYEPFVVRHGGSEGQFVTFRNAPGEKVVIGAAPNRHNILLQSAAGYKEPFGWIILEGLEVAHGAIDGVKAYNVHHWIMRGCDIHDAHDNNVLVVGSDHVTFDRNVFRGNGHLDEQRGRFVGHAIYATGNNWTVTNNLFYDAGMFGIQLAGYSIADYRDIVHPGYDRVAHWVVANNVFAFGKDGAGLTVWPGYTGSCDDVQIFNNIFYKNGERKPGNMSNGASLFAGIANVSIHDNLYFGSKEFLFMWSGTSFSVANNRQADPRFVAPEERNFELQPDSPAIDAGTAEGAPDHDFRQAPRPQGKGVDIGAYER